MTCIVFKQIDLHKDDQGYNISPAGISSNTVDDPLLHFHTYPEDVKICILAVGDFLDVFFHKQLDFSDDRVGRAIGDNGFLQEVLFSTFTPGYCDVVTY